MARLLADPSSPSISPAVAANSRPPQAPPRATCIQHEGTQPPLFVIPGVGGDAVSYGEFSRAMGTDRPIYVLRSVGLDAEAEPLDRVEAIAATFVKEIRRVQPDGPYRIAGVCIGGFVAYEIAQQLLAAGQETAPLVLVDTWLAAPVVAARRLFGHRVQFVRGALVRHTRAFWRRSFMENLRYIRRMSRVIREVAVTRDVYRGDQRSNFGGLVALRNRVAASRYIPRPYPGAVALIFAREDLPTPDDPRLKWKALALGGATLQHIPAKDSGFLLRAPHVQRFAGAMREQLERTRPPSRPSAPPLPSLSASRTSAIRAR
jgi:thioesterase domain-containing protein